MKDATYRLAAHGMSARLRGQPVNVGEQNRALLARWQALRQLQARLGVAALSPAMRRVGMPVMPAAIAGHRPASMVSQGLAARVERQSLRQAAVAQRGLPLRMPRLHAAVPEAGPRGPRQSAVAALVTPRLAMALMRDGGHGTATAAARRGKGGEVGSPPGPTGPSGVRLAALSRVAHAAPHRAAIAVPGLAARIRHAIAASPTPPAVGPGFHRTVRQAQPKAAAGDVYLDKTLVGYHLAGAITAEQTRAAARPNASGASFNSSMAALRPTGAGL